MNNLLYKFTYLIKFFNKINSYDEDFIRKTKEVFVKLGHRNVEGADFFLIPPPTDPKIVLNIFDEIESLSKSNSHDFLMISRKMQGHQNIFDKIEDLKKWIDLGYVSLSEENMKKLFEKIGNPNIFVQNKELLFDNKKGTYEVICKLL